MGQFAIGARYNDPPRYHNPTVGRKYLINCPPHTKGYGTKIAWGIVPDNTRIPQYWGNGKPAKRGFPVSVTGQFAYSFITLDDIKMSRDVGGIRCILINYGLYVASNQQLLWQAYESKFQHYWESLI